MQFALGVLKTTIARAFLVLVSLQVRVRKINEELVKNEVKPITLRNHDPPLLKELSTFQRRAIFRTSILFAAYWQADNLSCRHFVCRISTSGQSAVSRICILSRYRDNVNMFQRHQVLFASSSIVERYIAQRGAFESRLPCKVTWRRLIHSPLAPNHYFYGYTLLRSFSSSTWIVCSKTLSSCMNFSGASKRIILMSIYCLKALLTL